eukprot:UN20275
MGKNKHEACYKAFANVIAADNITGELIWAWNKTDLVSRITNIYRKAELIGKHVVNNVLP